MSPAQVRYHPDEWAHDLDEWWSPLTGLAVKADCASDDWLSVLGVGEFFEPRLLEQARVLTPWICLAASAVAASAARRWAEVAAQPDAGRSGARHGSLRRRRRPGAAPMGRQADRRRRAQHR